MISIFGTNLALYLSPGERVVLSNGKEGNVGSHTNQRVGKPLVGCCGPVCLLGGVTHPTRGRNPMSAQGGMHVCVCVCVCVCVWF